MKVTLDLKSLVSESRRKPKKKKGRGLMLSGFMKIVSSDLGEQLTKAVEDGDGDRIESLMKQIGAKMRSRFEKQ